MLAKPLSFAMVVLALASQPGLAQPQSIALHPDNARVRFKIGHIFSAVNGSFNTFRGQLKLDRAHPEASSISWEVNVRSVDTGNSSRDGHLLKEEYFNADAHPTISFVSRSVRVVDPTHLEVAGTFTLKGVSKNLTLPVTVDSNGLECEFEIHRSDYGLSAGKPAVHENVEIDLTITDKKIPDHF